MKIRIITGILLACLLLVAGLSACNQGSSQPETTRQIVEVTRSDMTISVTGSGNIDTPRDVSLTFGSGGKIEKLSVSEGDRVSKGDLLARLDTSSLELALTKEQVALTKEQVALTEAKLAQLTAEYNLKNTQDSKDTLELALFNAQIDVRTATFNLEKTTDLTTWSDIKIAQADVDAAKRYLADALNKLTQYDPGSEGYNTWQDTVVHAQARVDAAQSKLDAMLQSYDTEEVAIKRLQLEAAEKAETQARKNLDKLAQDIAIKELQVTSAKESAGQAQQSVDLARKSLADSQKKLDEATITAPFDGIVARIDAKEGDTIPSPTTSPRTVVYMIDTSTLELLIEVDEIDIPGVKVGQKTVITVDALPGAQFEGKVAAIYPLPKNEGGVVLYSVRIDFDAPGDSGLRVGMSASADIIISQLSNVITVPNRAVLQDSQHKPYVKVMVGDQVQDRPVTSGMSDALQTEITSGLTEGESVVIEIRAKAQSGTGIF